MGWLVNYVALKRLGIQKRLEIRLEGVEENWTFKNLIFKLRNLLTKPKTALLTLVSLGIMDRGHSEISLNIFNLTNSLPKGIESLALRGF